MIFALLTLLAALAVAAVTEWFSVVGIMAIYAGAPLNAALIMGLVLGGAKLVTISWLYRNWEFSGWAIKGPLIYFTIALMVASSIGVYGFLTKAHLEQGASTVNNSAKIERLDQQITREKSSIADNEKVIAQLDTAINSFLGKDRADRALSVRRSQAGQRKQLRDDIIASQKLIDSFSEEKLKLTSEVRAMQLEVGPIKYIADLFYGQGGDETTKMEAAVVIFTLLIVSTLDPLAVILLIAANHTLLRIQNEKKQKVVEKIRIAQEPVEAGNSAKDNKQSNIALEDKPGPVEDTNSLVAEVQEDIIVPLRYSESNDTTALDEEIFKEDSTQGVVSEEEITVMEKIEVENSTLDDIEINVTTDKSVEVGILENEPIIETPAAEVHKIQIAKPWATDAALLASLIGSQPHFIPQKIHEKTKQTELEIEAGNQEIPKDFNDWTAPANTQKIQEMAEDRPKEIQETHNKVSIPEGNVEIHIAPVTSANYDKYPKALSWLKEFKGD